MSLKQIAKMAGTSVATVSRVLNHPEHRCNDGELANRIWEIAAKLQYVPNSHARSLRMGVADREQHFIVDIFLARFDSLDEDVFFQELYHCVKEELINSGCIIGELLHVGEIENLSDKQDKGLLILGKCPSAMIPTLQKKYLCLAGIDRNPTDYQYDEVVCNGITAAEKAVEYLISLGHTSIAYIGDCTYEARYIGYYQTLLNHKLALNHKNVYPTNQTKEEGYRVMSAILKESERPTAIFCANDSTALGVLQALKQSKKRGYLPSVISIDNIDASSKTVPMLTTIDIPKQDMSHLAITLLLDRRRGRHSENVRLELPCRLLVRESCTWVGNHV